MADDDLIEELRRLRSSISPNSAFQKMSGWSHAIPPAKLKLIRAALDLALAPPPAPDQRTSNPPGALDAVSPTRPSWDSYFLGIAQAVATRADCRRRRVGAVLVDTDHRVLEVGYNGAPAGHPGCLSGACPRGRLSYGEVPAMVDYSDPTSPAYCISNHAELNALLLCGRSARGATIYITHEPCPACRKAIMGAGVVRAVWPGYELDATIPDGVPAPCDTEWNAMPTLDDQPAQAARIV